MSHQDRRDPLPPGYQFPTPRVRMQTIVEAMRECKSFTEMFDWYDVSDLLIRRAEMVRMTEADATGAP